MMPHVVLKGEKTWKAAFRINAVTGTTHTHKKKGGRNGRISQFLSPNRGRKKASFSRGDGGPGWSAQRAAAAPYPPADPKPLRRAKVTQRWSSSLAEGSRRQPPPPGRRLSGRLGPERAAAAAAATAASSLTAGNGARTRPARPAPPLAQRARGGGPSRQPGAPPPAAAAGRDHLSPWREGGEGAPPRLPACPASPPRRAEPPSAWRAAWSRPAQALAPAGAGRGRPGILRRGGGGCSSPAPRSAAGAERSGSSQRRPCALRRAVPLHPTPSAPISFSVPPDNAMKPAVLEVMRMNRVCRMVLVTSVGSFILVIFYFQSMLHPGRAPAPQPHRAPQPRRHRQPAASGSAPAPLPAGGGRPGSHRRLPPAPVLPSRRRCSRRGARWRRRAQRPAALSRPPPGAAAGRSLRPPRGREESCFIFKIYYFLPHTMRLGEARTVPAGERRRELPGPCGSLPAERVTPVPVPRGWGPSASLLVALGGCRGHRGRPGTPPPPEGNFAPALPSWPERRGGSRAPAVPARGGGLA